jgi:excisionase family DNA binding protein
MASRRTAEPAESTLRAELLTVKQAAAVMAVSRTTVYKLIHDGAIKVVYVGADMRIPTSEIRRFIERETRRAS